MFPRTRRTWRRSPSDRALREPGPKPRVRRGITLIEMMVSITLTLIIMGTVMTIFGMITGAVADNRALMETVDRLKSATARLQADLQGLTCSTMPWNRIESASGYFVYAEGLATDATPKTDTSWLQIPEDEIMRELAKDPSFVLGDCDDVLMMTSRSRGAPFVGKGPNGPIESYLAEVVWFVRPAEVNATVKPLLLYRRVLLIIGPEQWTRLGVGGTSPQEFFSRYDISAHYDQQSGRMVANTLADLTMPENRFAHSVKGASVGSISVGGDSMIRPFPMSSERYGEDIMLTNVVGFDVKGFDSWGGFGTAAEDGVAMVPGDFSYSTGAGSRGVYVDIGSGGGDYAGQPRQESTLAGISGLRGVYDTWSFHYEHDGISRRGGKDRGTDLLDSDGTGGVDDAAERATSAPYLRPLRGIEVSVRAYEPDSRQVQQVTIVSDFTP